MVGRSRQAKHRPCWTCRLRRKRCDFVRPVCNACSTLGITCHNADERPSWVDGDVKQREAAQKLSAEIKERKRLQREQKDGGGFLCTIKQGYSRAAEGTSTSTPGERRDSVSTGREHEQPQDSSGMLVPPHMLFSGIYSPESALPLSENGRAWEEDILMIYIDQVFPYLFPFYRPPLVGTSRSWLLRFVRQSSAIYHSVLSLGSYFLTIGLNNTYPGKRMACTSVLWNSVVQQSERSFGRVQQDLLTMTEGEKAGVSSSVPERARVFQTIVHLLISELFIRSGADWNLHLEAAITLFCSVFDECSQQSPTRPGLTCVLDELTWPGPQYPTITPERPMWNPEQAAFRFFTGVLIFLDVIASTSLGRSPKLVKYHEHILGELKLEEISWPLELSAFVGVGNWVVIAIATIAELDASNRIGCEDVSNEELCARAYQVSVDLRHGLQTLDERLNSMNAKPGDLHSARKTALPTRIWARAAQIFLFVVLNNITSSSGQTPIWADPEMQEHITEILDLLDGMDTMDELHAFAWPFCVAGCFASSTDQKATFEKIGARRISGHPPSAMDQAVRIVKEVWRRRGEGEGAVLTLAECLCILGPPALLA